MTKDRQSRPSLCLSLHFLKITLFLAGNFGAPAIFPRENRIGKRRMLNVPRTEIILPVPQRTLNADLTDNLA